MKKAIITKRNLLNLLLAFLFIFQSNVGNGQKNNLKITPLKFGFFKKNEASFEREIFKNHSILLGYQFWDIDKEETKKVFFGADKTRNYRHRGNGLTIEIRGYAPLEIKERDLQKKENDRKAKITSINFLYGLVGVWGKHEVATTQDPYYETDSFGIFGSTPTTTYFSEKRGGLELISSGVLLKVGFQVKINKRIIFEFSVLGGKKWINHEEDFYILSPLNPDDESKKVFVENELNGLFFDSAMLMGYAF